MGPWLVSLSSGLGIRAVGSAKDSAKAQVSLEGSRPLHLLTTALPELCPLSEGV